MKCDLRHLVTPKDLGVKIKQLLPIPDHITVLILDWDENEKEYLVDCKETCYPYLLALVEYGDGDSMVYPYSAFDNFIDTAAQIFNKRTCPICGEPMKINPELCNRHVLEVKYQCKDCDYSDKGFYDDCSGMVGDEGNAL